MNTKDDITETTELRPLQYFCLEFPGNFQGGKKLHKRFLPFEPIGNEVLPDIDVVIMFVSLLSTIILRFDVTLIILMYYVVLYLLLLILQEVQVPYHLCQDIVDSDKFGFS